MAALSINVDFASYLDAPVEEERPNLENSTLIEVMEVYAKERRMEYPDYDNHDIITNIQEIESMCGKTIYPIKISKKFYQLFYDFHLSKGVLPSTTKNYCGRLVTILEWAAECHAHVSKTYRKYKVDDYCQTKVALSPDEVSMIYHFDIDHAFKYNETGKRTKANHIKTLKKVRDMFVLACSLSLRYSDMRRITPDCFFDNNRVLRIRNQKTSRESVVNIPEFCFDRKTVYEILERSGYYAPYTATINNYLKILHELIKKIGFSEMVKSENKIKGKMVVEYKPRYELIASHTARRTFVTYNLQRGKSEEAVMRCTAHQDAKTMRGYHIWQDFF